METVVRIGSSLGASTVDGTAAVAIRDVGSGGSAESGAERRSLRNTKRHVTETSEWGAGKRGARMLGQVVRLATVPWLRAKRAAYHFENRLRSFR